MRNNLLHRSEIRALRQEWVDRCERHHAAACVRRWWSYSDWQTVRAEQRLADAAFEVVMVLDRVLEGGRKGGKETQ